MKIFFFFKMLQGIDVLNKYQSPSDAFHFWGFSRNSKKLYTDGIKIVSYGCIDGPRYLTDITTNK